MASDKFVYRPGDVVVSQCRLCRHAATGRGFHPEAELCRAFPGGIPPEIFANELDHRLPHPDDGGVRFKPRPGLHPAVVRAVAHHFAAQGRPTA